jgi:hypothetical protein
MVIIIMSVELSPYPLGRAYIILDDDALLMDSLKTIFLPRPFPISALWI